MRRINILLLCLIVTTLAGCSQIVPNAPLPAVSNAVVAAPDASVLLTAEQQQQFEQAKQALQQRDFATAATQLSQLYTALPGSPGVGYNLALAQWQNGDAALAQQTLAQLSQAGIQFAPAHNLAGVLARQQGHFYQAERHFKQALQADAGYAIAHKNLAFLNELYLGELLQAHYHYQQYYALTQDAQAKVWLALLQQQLEQDNADN